MVMAVLVEVIRKRVNLISQVVHGLARARQQHIRS